MFQSKSMLVLVYSVFVWAHGASMKADGEVQEAPQSVLPTVEPREPVQILPLQTCSLVIPVDKDTVLIDLVKESEEVEDRRIVLKGQQVTCMRGEEEAAERYVDHNSGAEALFVSHISGGMLTKSLVLLFTHNGSEYSVEPLWGKLSNCVAKEGGLQPLESFVIFGGMHFLFVDIDPRDGDVDPVSELWTTTEEGPVTPEPPKVGLVFAIVFGMLLFFLAAFCCWCCCCKRSSYNNL